LGSRMGYDGQLDGGRAGIVGDAVVEEVFPDVRVVADRPLHVLRAHGSRAGERQVPALQDALGGEPFALVRNVLWRETAAGSTGI
jgi:hypothetical protein